MHKGYLLNSFPPWLSIASSGPQKIAPLSQSLAPMSMNMYKKKKKKKKKNQLKLFGCL